MRAATMVNDEQKKIKTAAMVGADDREDSHSSSVPGAQSDTVRF